MYEQHNLIFPDFVDYVLKMERTTNGNKNNQFVFKTDYARPIGTNFKLEAGGKFSTGRADIYNYMENFTEDEL